MWLQPTEKEEKFRPKLSNCIAISKPQGSTKQCIVCKKTVERGDLNFIIYLNHPTYKFYEWIHMKCLGSMDKVMRPPNKIKDRVLSYIDAHKCSFCDKGIDDKDKVMLGMEGVILFHRDCVKKFHEEGSKLILQHSAKITCEKLK